MQVEAWGAGHEGWLSTRGLLGGPDLSNLLGWVGWGGEGSGGKRDLLVGGGDGDRTAQPAEGPLQVWELRARYLVCERFRGVCWARHWAGCK